MVKKQTPPGDGPDGGAGLFSKPDDSKLAPLPAADKPDPHTELRESIVFGRVLAVVVGAWIGAIAGLIGRRWACP